MKKLLLCLPFKNSLHSKKKEVEMHRVLSNKTMNTSRQINDKGEIVSRTKDELDRFSSSARTPRINHRSKTQLSNNTKTKQKTIVSGGNQRSKSKVTFYSDPRQQARDLMIEGIHCTATNQKHEIINQLGNLLLQQINQTEIYQNDSERLNSKNQELEKSLSEQRASTAKVQRDTAKVTQLRHLKTLRNDEKLIQDIQQIEEDAKRYVHLSEPWLLQEILDNNDDEKIEELVNLKFRRLEDLIYALRRQILQDQDIISVLPIINSKFGSVRNLLNKYEEALSIIDKLKIREFKVANDELTKRRSLGSYDVQSLHTLIIALQNELIETKTQLRLSLLSINSSSGKYLDQHEHENTTDFDSASRYNMLEAKYNDLLKRYEKIKQDNELLQTQVNLESEVLRSGIFTVENKMKGKLLEVNKRIHDYYDKIDKMQNTIDLQSRLVTQFQKEKSACIRQKMVMNSHLEEMREKVEEAEARVRKAERRVDSIRAVARIIAEDTLVSRNGYSPSFEQINQAFFKSFQKYDSAALLIQRCWRKKRNPSYEKRLILKNHSFPITQIISISALDAIAGKMKPVTYKQIVHLLKSYSSELKRSTLAPIQLMKNYIEKSHKDINYVSETCLCRAKRFNWAQTIPDRIDLETQTEKQPLRAKK